MGSCETEKMLKRGSCEWLREFEKGVFSAGRPHNLFQGKYPPPVCASRYVILHITDLFQFIGASDQSNIPMQITVFAVTKSS